MGTTASLSAPRDDDESETQSRRRAWLPRETTMSCVSGVDDKLPLDSDPGLYLDDGGADVSDVFDAKFPAETLEQVAN